MAKSKRPHHILIAYTSGHTIDFWCEDFSIQVAAGGRSVSWTNASPRPMFINVNEIESVWELNPDVRGDGAVV